MKEAVEGGGRQAGGRTGRIKGRKGKEGKKKGNREQKEEGEGGEREERKKTNNLEDGRKKGGWRKGRRTGKG